MTATRSVRILVTIVTGTLLAVSLAASSSGHYVGNLLYDGPVLHVHQGAVTAP
jgi:hypothetical protein